MRKLVVLLFGAFFMSLFIGCSMQKRNLLSGYHIEWQRGPERTIEGNTAKQQLIRIQSEPNVDYSVVASSNDDLSASAVQPAYPKIIASLPHIALDSIDSQWDKGQLIEPQPWEAAEMSQKLFENIGWGASIVGVLLSLLDNPGGLVGILFSVMMVAFSWSRYYRKKVLDIKSRSGIDVTEERRRERFGFSPLKIRGRPMFSPQVGRTILIVIGILSVLALVFLVLVLRAMLNGTWFG
jgi:hypothetical protein